MERQQGGNRKPPPRSNFPYHVAGSLPGGVDLSTSTTYNLPSPKLSTLQKTSTMAMDDKPDDVIAGVSSLTLNGGKENDGALSAIQDKTCRISTKEDDTFGSIQWDDLHVFKLPAAQEIPIGRVFWAKWLGFNCTGHYGWINIISKTKWMFLVDLETKIESEYNSVYNRTPQIIPLSDLKNGMYVVARIGNGEAEYHIRGRIQQLNSSTQLVEVFDVDTAELNWVSADRIYRMSKTATSYPPQAIKISQIGLDLFDENSDYVTRAADALPILEDYVFQAKLIQEGNVPCIQLVDSKGVTFAEKILGQLSRMCVVPIPDIGVPTPATITHFDSSGHLWYQLDNDQLVNMLLEFDEFVKYEQIVGDPAFGSGVRNELNIPGAIFAARYSRDGRFYRAVVNTILDNDRVLVDFIDFGNQEAVQIDSMLAMTAINEAFKYIPPQARKAKMYGVESVEPDVCNMFLESTLQTNLVVISNEEDCPYPVVEVVGITDGHLSNNPESSLIQFLCSMNSTSP